MKIDKTGLVEKLYKSFDTPTESTSLYEQLQYKAPPSLSEDNAKISCTKRNYDDFKNIQAVKSGDKEIKKGSKGNDIKLIQESLQDMGFYIGDSADGIFGSQTMVAVKNFQSSRNLPITGIIDQKTMQEIEKVAPPKGKKLWDTGILDALKETSKENIVPSNELLKGKRAKIVIDLSEHRLFLYNDDNSLKKVYSVATGRNGNPDGRGGATHTGIKIVNSKNNDPSAVAEMLWPETKGKAFGTKLLDLSWYDIETKKKKSSGEELHGTYARNSVGTDASHGCMRMENEDIEEVFSQVKTGDLIKIQD